MLFNSNGFDYQTKYLRTSSDDFKNAFHRDSPTRAASSCKLQSASRDCQTPIDFNSILCISLHGIGSDLTQGCSECCGSIIQIMAMDSSSTPPGRKSVSYRGVPRQAGLGNQHGTDRSHESSGASP